MVVLEKDRIPGEGSMHAGRQVNYQTRLINSTLKMKCTGAEPKLLKTRFCESDNEYSISRYFFERVISTLNEREVLYCKELRNIIYHAVRWEQNEILEVNNILSCIISIIIMCLIQIL
jgi:hypothetical protein